MEGKTRCQHGKDCRNAYFLDGRPKKNNTCPFDHTDDDKPIVQNKTVLTWEIFLEMKKKMAKSQKKIKEGRAKIDEGMEELTGLFAMLELAFNQKN